MKACFDDITGQPFPEDDNNEVSITKRVAGKLMQAKFDLSPASALKVLDLMAQQKPPKWQIWINATDEERAKNKNAKGHWEPAPSVPSSASTGQ